MALGTLYLDRKHLKVTLDGEAVAFYEEGTKKGTVPMGLLERVVFRGDIETDTRVLGALAERGIGMLLLSGRHSRAMATLVGKPHNDVRRRLAQYQGYLDVQEREVVSRWLVLTKLRAQKRFLQTALSKRPDVRYALTTALKTVETNLLSLQAEAAIPLQRLRGLEGSAAAAYFKGLQALFPASLGFTARVKRPPTDPVNACLSLSYTLLHFEAVRCCQQAGLEPLLGVYHDPAFGRESLACDMIEPLRPAVDALVWQLFRDRILRAEHFDQDKGACLLNKTGRQYFYAEYERCAQPLRRLLRRYSYALAARYLQRYQAVF